jgi:hypothetical protein
MQWVFYPRTPLATGFMASNTHAITLSAFLRSALPIFLRWTAIRIPYTTKDANRQARTLKKIAVTAPSSRPALPAIMEYAKQRGTGNLRAPGSRKQHLERRGGGFADDTEVPHGRDCSDKRAPGEETPPGTDFSP